MLFELLKEHYKNKQLHLLNAIESLPISNENFDIKNAELFVAVNEESY